MSASCGLCKTGCNDGYCMYCGSCAKCDDWIKVSSSLPCMGVVVLVDGVDEIPINAYRVADADFGYKWLDYSDDEWVVGVKHWSHLPEIIK